MTNNLESNVSLACPSQLDSIETSIQSLDYQSYQDYRLRHDSGEWLSTIDAYGRIDDEDGSHRLDSLNSCRRFSWFSMHKVTRRVIVQTNSCGLRWCPLCSQSRALFVRMSVQSWITSLRAPKFLTLTMAHNKAPLSEQIDTLYQHYRNFRRHKFLKRWTRGGIWFFQVKQSKNDHLWHPHLHIVLDSDYMSKFNLSQEWFQTTSSSNIIDIRRINDVSKIAEYVSRYVSRPSNLKEFDRGSAYQIIRSLHGRRLSGAFGSARGVPLRPVPSEDVGQWQNIASWDSIVPLRLHSPSASLVLRCWLSGHPLPQNFNFFSSSDSSPADIPVVRKSNEDRFGNFYFKEFL